MTSFTNYFYGELLAFAAPQAQASFYFWLGAEAEAGL